MVKNLPANVGDVRDAGLIPGSGRSLGEENGNPLQSFCLENPLGRGAWWAAVHGVAESRTRLSESLTRVFVIPWTASCQASLSFTRSWSLIKLMSIELVMLFNHFTSDALFSSCPQSFPESRSFPMSQFFTSGGLSIGTSASTLVLPMNIQD